MQSWDVRTTQKIINKKNIIKLHSICLNKWRNVLLCIPPLYLATYPHVPNLTNQIYY